MNDDEETPGLVHVIDDDAGVRESLGQLLRSEGFDVALHEATDSVLGACAARRPACLLLDIRLAGEDGLDFQERLVAEGVTLPIILMTGHGDIPMTVRGMKAGALDFLPKPVDAAALVKAVRQAIELDRAKMGEEDELANLRARYETLTGREREVMALVVTGLMNKQVAGELNLSEITVKVHRGSVMRKMGVRTLPDLVRIASRLQV